jgi:hypothetical protein
MTSRDFVYWMQGLFELGKPTELNAEQTDLVKRHLALVFLHEIDPSAGPPAHQQMLNELHKVSPNVPFNPGASAQGGSLTVNPTKPHWGAQDTDGPPAGTTYRC